MTRDETVADGATPIVIDPAIQEVMYKSPTEFDGGTTAPEREYDAPEYDGEDAALFEAFVAGFKCSHEGGNAEYPHAYNDDRIIESLADDFEDWRGDE